MFPQLAAFTGGPGTIRVVGHRGARGILPENTMVGFEFTLSIGVDLLEFDVLVSRDGVPVIIHNHRLTASIVRGADGKYLKGDGPKVSTLNFADLQQYDVGALDGRTEYGMRFPDQAVLFGARIPRLADLMEMATQDKYASTHLLLEMKSDPDKAGDAAERARVVASVVADVRRYGLEPRTILHSFDWNLLAECQRVAPDLPTSFLTQMPNNDEEIGEDSALEVVPSYVKSVEDLPDLVANAGGKLWCPYFEDVTPESIQRARELGLPVVVWTVNEPADIETMIDYKVDAIVSDYPGRVQRHLVARGQDWWGAPRLSAG